MLKSRRNPCNRLPACDRGSSGGRSQSRFAYSGSYSVTVNGSRADFKLDTANSTSSLRTADTPFVKDDIKVDAVNIDVGVGSPIPVYAIVSANLPNAPVLN